MTRIHHLNCGSMRPAPGQWAVSHCLLLEDRVGLALVDTGLGLLDVRAPLERLGQPLIDEVGFVLDESEAATRQIETLGFGPAAIQHVVLTHGDPDHTGGLADFPAARVHIGTEEHRQIGSGNGRYVPAHFEHGPRWEVHAPSPRRWFGLEAREVALGFASEVLLIPFFGHTLGHCGVAVQQGERWTLHVGDAYYLRVETETDDHPISALTTQRADDDALRRTSLDQIRRLLRNHADQIDLFGYHDPSEFPSAQGR